MILIVTSDILVNVFKNGTKPLINFIFNEYVKHNADVKKNR